MYQMHNYHSPYSIYIIIFNNPQKSKVFHKILDKTTQNQSVDLITHISQRIIYTFDKQEFTYLFDSILRFRIIDSFYCQNYLCKLE